MTEATQKTVKDSSGVRMTFIFITCQPAFACFREMQGRRAQRPTRGQHAGCPILGAFMFLPQSGPQRATFVRWGDLSG